MKGEYGYTLLHIACININSLSLDVFKLLIETLGCDVNVQDHYKNTPIHHALDKFNPNDDGDKILLTYLINQKNFNINIKDLAGYTFLHYACRESFLGRSAVLNAEYDTILCQIFETIADRCVQDLLDEKTPIEATTTM
jgi:ankyrin repeat protein